MHAQKTRSISSANADPEPISDRTRTEEAGLATSRGPLIKPNDHHVITQTRTTTPAVAGATAIADFDNSARWEIPVARVWRFGNSPRRLVELGLKKK
jgi:hypothetical protein